MPAVPVLNRFQDKLMNLRFVPLLAGMLMAAALDSGAANVMPQAATASPSTSPRFDVTRFDVRGNTVLAQPELDGLLAPFTGRQRDFASIQDAVHALEAAYSAGGYQMVRVDLPEQELDGGVVVIQVVMTRFGRITISGNSVFDDANIRRSLPGLQEGQAADLQDISRQLRLANENPAKKTLMRLQSGQRDDEVDVALAVQDEKLWTGSASMDNGGTRQTGKTHVGAGIQHANLLGFDDVFSAQTVTTVEQPGRVKVYSAAWHLPLYATGDSVDLFGSYSNVNAGTVSAGIFDIAVSGKGSTVGARYNQGLDGVGGLSGKLVYGVDYKAYRNNMQVQGLELGNDITVHPLSLGYLGTWSGSMRTFDFGLSLLHNIAGGANGGRQDFERQRSGADASYNMLRLAATLTQALPKDMQLRAILNGQYSSDALVPGEQFGAGGAGSVRGFDAREVANDKGIAGNLELYSAPLCRDASWQCRVLAFYDHAYTARNHALPGEYRRAWISGAGVGLRLQFARNVDLQVDVARALHADTTLTRPGDMRVHARLGLSF